MILIVNQVSRKLCKQLKKTLMIIGKQDLCQLTEYSQTCVQRPPLGPEKRGRYAEGCMKKISGKQASGWSLWLQAGRYGFRLAVIQRWLLGQV